MKANLLAGNPITVDFFKVYPWKLRDIVNEELKYQEKLFIFLVSKKHLSSSIELVKEYDVLQLIRLGAILTEAFRDQVLDSLKAFTHEDFVFIDEKFMLNDNILETHHWEKIRDILAEENSIDLTLMEEEKIDESKLSPQAIAFRKRIAETKALVNKYKKSPQNDLSFLINRFCAKSQNMNLLNVWDLTFYQFRQQLDAMIVIEHYDFNMLAAAGGNLDLRKQKIVHWTENN